MTSPSEADAQRVCERCKWWKAETNPWGECRRRAPVFIGKGYENSRPAAYTRTESFFPQTVRSDWCGEFTARASEGEKT